MPRQYSWMPSFVRRDTSADSVSSLGCNDPWAGTWSCKYSTSSYLGPLDYSEFFAVETMPDITTAWGSLTTPEQVQASPYYTRIQIPVNPQLTEAWRINSVEKDWTGHSTCDVSTFTLHAAHPIPMRYLRQLSPPQLRYLGEYLLDDNSEDDRADDLYVKVAQTIVRIDDLLEHRVVWGLSVDRLASLVRKVYREGPAGGISSRASGSSADAGDFGDGVEGADKEGEAVMEVEA